MNTLFSFIATNTRNIKVFTRFLLSFMTILLIPTVVIYFVLYSHTVDILENEIKINNENMLFHIRDIVDQQINKIYKISASISTNSELSPNSLKRLEEDIIKARDTIYLLNIYCLSDPFIDYLILYIHGHDYVFSNRSSFTHESFMQGLGKEWEPFTRIPEGNFIPELLPTRKINNSALNYNNTPVFIFHHTIPIGSYKSYGELYFMVRETSLQKLISHITENNNYNTIVLDSNNNILTSTSQTSYLQSDDFVAFVNQLKEDGFNKINLDGTDYYVSSITSTLNGWKYITVLPSQYITKNVDYLRNQISLAFLLMLGIGIILVLILSIVNYRPIKRIRRLLHRETPAIEKKGNDFTIIEEAFTKMSQHNKQLTQQIEQNKEAVQEYYLLNLIKGRYVDEESILKNMASQGLVFSGKYYFVGILLIEEYEQLPTDISMVQVVRRCLPSTLSGGIVEDIRDSSIILILSTNINNMQQLKPLLKEIKNSLCNSFSIRCTFSVGSLYEKITLVGRSFIEARSYLDYRLISGKNIVITPDEIEKISSYTFNYPQKKMIELSLALSDGKIQQAIDFINNIFDTIEENKMPIYAVRCICFDIINTVVKTIVDMCITLDEFEKIIPNVIEMSKFDTISDLRRVIIKTCIDLTPLIQTSQIVDSDEVLVRQIREYIDKNCFHYNFSIQSMAQYFDMSTSYISRYFKQHTGLTPIKYTQQRRIKKAMELLISTDLTIQEIVQQIGYVDIPTFISRFKKSIGVTPGEFRENYQKSDMQYSKKP